jgi:hypothetical protein
MIRRSAIVLSLLGLGLSTACTVEKKEKPEGKGGEGGDDAGPGETGGTAGASGTGGMAGIGGSAGMSTIDGGADAGECGSATVDGECDGTEVVFCQAGKAARVDCAKIGSTCAVTKGRADCSNGNREASCGALTPKGTCDGAVIKYCDATGIAAVPREINCAAYGQKCDPTAGADGGADCVPQGPCGTGVDENGVCDASNHLSFCQDSQEYTFDCGVDMCQVQGGFADCFVVGSADGCGTETAAGRCDGKTRVSCQSGVIAREQCDTLGMECRANAAGGGFRCQAPAACPATCPTGTKCTAGVCAGDPATTADWTLMVYMIANNNLSRAGWADLNEMETVGTTKAVNVVAEVKFSPDYSYDLDPQFLGNKVFRMEVDKDSDTSDVTSLQGSQTGGSFNMSDPARVAEFVKWGAQLHPAKHYALVMWNHGAGYKEAFVDGDTLLSLKDVVDGIRDSQVHLDLVGFDACLMGMQDVAYSMRGVANYLIASEEVEPGAGYPYDDILTGLAADTKMNAAGLGTLIVDKYAESYVGGYRPQDVTSSVIDLSKVEAATEQLASVADALKTDSAGNRGALRQSLDDSTSVLRFVQREDADLTTVMSTLSTLDLGAASKKATGDFVTYLADSKNLIVHSRASGELGAAKGIAVFVPQGSSGSYYGGSDLLEGYKSRTSFLPMQPWISFVSALTDDSAPAPKPATGAVATFSVVLDWASEIDGKTSGADLDLYVFEPGGDFATPSNGTVSGSGVLSGDSYDTSVPEESYQLSPTHEVGTYVILAHYYDGGPNKEKAYPTLQVFRPDLQGGSRTLLRAKGRDLEQIPMDGSNPLKKKIDSTNFQGVVDLEYSNLWYATTIEVK